MAGEVGFTLSEADYVAANKAWMGIWLRRPRTLAGYAALLAGMAGVMAGLTAADDGARDEVLASALVVLVGGTAIVALCLTIGRLFLPWQARRIFRQSVSLHKAYRYRWSDAGLAYESETESGTRPWHELHRWSEGRDVFLFFLNEKLFYIFPHRVLTAAQVEDLRATLAAHGPPRF